MREARSLKPEVMLSDYEGARGELQGHGVGGAGDVI